jgi:thioredoxin reductase (NADPH)
MIDCLVIGGGPAGVTAAIYLKRFHLDVRVIDAGKSRVTWIPRTRNHAGYPGGVPGTELLAKMREQLAEFGVAVEDGVVEHAERTDEGFSVRTAAGETVAARALLMATGVVNKT